MNRPLDRDKIFTSVVDVETILESFEPDTLFHIVDVETILGDEETWSRQARVTVCKGNNF